jgi:hypothetical protein
MAQQQIDAAGDQAGFRFKDIEAIGLLAQDIRWNEEWTAGRIQNILSECKQDGNCNDYRYVSKDVTPAPRGQEIDNAGLYEIGDRDPEG